MRAAIAALGVAFILAALSVPALGDAADPAHQALLDSTVRFLQESQQEDGGFAQAGEPSQGTSAWVSLALAAAGINPRNQARPCGADAYTYLAESFRREAGASAAPIATTDLQRELLVVDASGADPHAFGGFDLVEEILARQLPDGSFPFLPGGEGQINATAFAILSLSPIEQPSIDLAVRGAREWLVAEQNGDGGWSWRSRGTFSEVDMTGAAIQALNAAGPPSDPAQLVAFEAALREGLGYLAEAQLPDGGFPALPASQSESNVASTAWAVQAIWSAGGNPESWRTGSGLASEEPLGYMESMQQPDGHIRWSKSADSNGVWMTAYVAPAFAGHALPIPQATFSSASRPPCSPEDGEARAGVIAGGGGRGAPPFSRPKPQSRGRTPGGARILRDGSPRRRDRGRGRRGANAVQPTGTEMARGPGMASGAAGAALVAVAPRAVESASASGGREVSGIVIGDPGSARDTELALGAPGLRSAGDAAGGEGWVAGAIGAAALLLALGGARWERRDQGVLA